jgi:hypothetical protein
MLEVIPSSGDSVADLLAALFYKSDGNIEGCLQLSSIVGIDRIQDILKYWSEISKSPEQREKEVRQKASEQADKWMKQNVENPQQMLDKILALKQKAYESHQTVPPNS